MSVLGAMGIGVVTQCTLWSTHIHSVVSTFKVIVDSCCSNGSTLSDQPLHIGYYPGGVVDDLLIP